MSTKDNTQENEVPKLKDLIIKQQEKLEEEAKSTLEKTGPINFFVNETILLFESFFR